MEDPIRFDVWAKVRPGRRDSAVARLQTGTLYSSELTIRGALAQASRDDAHLLVATGTAYSEVQMMIELWSEFADIVVLQEGYTPSDETFLCLRHNLRHGGSRGCHICSGFYVR